MRKSARGFTLVELLVVIAIIAILAVIVGVVINPIELRKRSNDAARLSDMANLQQAINVAAQEATVSGEAILCKDLAVPCTGSSNVGEITAARKSDGTGWVKVDLSAQKSVSMPVLPVDPINSDTLFYTYKSDGIGWELNATLESDQQTTKMVNDGGDNAGRYEVGSTLGLIN